MTGEKTTLPPSDAPIEQYIRWACENRGDAREYDEPWNSPLWTFVRLLKAHPELTSKRPEQVLKIVESQLQRWRRGGIEDNWTYFFDVSSREDAHVEILDIWDKIRFVPGEEPLDQAANRAAELPLKPRNERTTGYATFVSIAGWLQVIMGDRNILLPCQKLSSYLQCEPMTVSRYRRWAVEDGLLFVRKEHRFRGPGGGEATEFRFDVGRFEMLKAKAARTPRNE